MADASQGAKRIAAEESIDALIRLAVDQSREHAMILLDAEGRVLWWNYGASHIFNASPEEMRGEEGARFFTPEDVKVGMPQYEMAVGRSAGAAEDDRWTLRADGSRFWASGILFPLRRDGRLVGYAKIIRDRTDLKEQTEQLELQIEALKEADKQKNIFLSTLSHELRNPLAPLTNAVELLRLTAPDMAKLQYPIKLIERQVEFIRRLVDDLMDVTRIGAGKVELHKTTLTLRDVLEKTIEAVDVPKRRTHAIELLLPEGTIEFEGDASRLHQVFLNLLNNAVKYTPTDGRIWVKGTTEGNEVIVRIEDTGVGIAPDMLPRIFELFTQVDVTVSQGGVGIGLTLVKQLVTLHGGTVQARSEGVGKGAEFTVRLPFAGGNAADKP